MVWWTVWWIEECDPCWTSLSDEFLQHTRAVAMTLHIDAVAMQQREPGIAEWSIFGDDEMLAKFDAR